MDSLGEFFFIKLCGKVVGQNLFKMVKMNLVTPLRLICSPDVVENFVILWIGFHKDRALLHRDTYHGVTGNFKWLSNE